MDGERREDKKVKGRGIERPDGKVDLVERP